MNVYKIEYIKVQQVNSDYIVAESFQNALAQFIAHHVNYDHLDIVSVQRLATECYLTG
jgi:hypothetical protein